MKTTTAATVTAGERTQADVPATGKHTSGPWTLTHDKKAGEYAAAAKADVVIETDECHIVFGFNDGDQAQADNRRSCCPPFCLGDDCGGLSSPHPREYGSRRSTPTRAARYQRELKQGKALSPETRAVWSILLCGYIAVAAIGCAIAIAIVHEYVPGEQMEIHATYKATQHEAMEFAAK